MRAREKKGKDGEFHTDTARRMAEPSRVGFLARKFSLHLLFDAVLPLETSIFGDIKW
jgi:hypothetical protein